jgi:hypothetical protein
MFRPLCSWLGLDVNNNVIGGRWQINTLPGLDFAIVSRTVRSSSGSSHANECIVHGVPFATPTCTLP